MSGAIRKLTLVGIVYMYVHLCVYVEGNPIETLTPTHCNPIGRSMTAWPLVLSPISNLPSPSLRCIFIPARKIFGAGFKNVISSFVSWRESVTHLSERPRYPFRGSKEEVTSHTLSTPVVRSIPFHFDLPPLHKAHT
jgi:hypothetical protein